MPTNLNQKLVETIFDQIMDYIDVKLEDLSEEETDILIGLLKDEI